MDTTKASKLLRELKGSKFLPHYNVNTQPYKSALLINVSSNSQK